MLTSLLLLVKFIIDIAKRIIQDNFFRALASVLLIILVAGTLFFWLAEHHTFLQAFEYAVATMAMNSPYGIGWQPTTTAGVIFNIIYTFISVGIFLLFVLETGKTMVQTYEEFHSKMAERKARKQAKSKGDQEK